MLNLNHPGMMRERRKLTPEAVDPLHMCAENCLSIEGRVTRTPDVSKSPGGVPITRFMLEHFSHRQEAGQQREVRCKIGVVAAGAALHSGMPIIAKDSLLRVRGFISQAGYRSGDYQLMLHAEQIEQIKTEIDY